jgi:methylmalonyl-CoA mutase N-terminal domain/subunit
VGINKYQEEAQEDPVPTLKIDPEVERQQIERIQKLRETRDAQAARDALDAVRQAAAGKENLVPRIITAVKAGVTLGEISDVFREVYGQYRDPAFF